MELSSAGTENMQVRTLCSTLLFVQWLLIAWASWTSSFGLCLSHFVGQESVANKRSILPCIRPNQRCSKYPGSASSYRRGCHNFSFSHSGESCGSSRRTKHSWHRRVQSFREHLSISFITSSIVALRWIRLIPEIEHHLGHMARAEQGKMPS